MKLLKYYLFIFLVIFCGSCVIQAPKFTTIDKVLEIKMGSTQEEVSSLLKIPPYDLKSIDSSGYVLIYKYRTNDRNTVPLFMGPTNGVKARGKWVDLMIKFSTEGKVVEVNSCSECSETETKTQKIDINALITLITITVPSILILLKLKD